MIELYGYPQAEGAEKSRPWWIFKSLGTHYRRTDGVEVYYCQEKDSWFVIEPNLDEFVEINLDLSWGDAGGPKAMKEVDKRFPLEAPPPLCNQVWVDPETCREQTIIAVDNGKAIFLTLGYVANIDVAVKFTSPPEWPPPGMVLVSGPKSPWSKDAV